MEFLARLEQAWDVCDKFDLQTEIWRGRILKSVRDREKRGGEGRGGGQGDGADVHRAICRNLGRPFQLERRIARKDRAACINGWGNVPNFFHEAQR